MLVPFWCAVLGYEPVRGDDGRSTDEIVDPDGVLPLIWFQTVPEGKTAKNRVHLDPYFPRDEIDARVRNLVELGGEVQREFPSFVTMIDPEGNEFCLCWDDDETGDDDV